MDRERASRQKTDDPAPPFILMVDPNDLTRSAFAAYLESKGLETQTARSGEEALRKIRRRRPDLVVTDIDLPGMSGATFIKTISSRRGGHRCPVLIFSADAEMAALCRAFAVAGFVPKTMYGGDLLRKILEILESEKAVHDAHTVPAEVSVLLAEDEPALAGGIGQALVRAGFTVEKAESGPEVIEKAARINPRVILMKEVLSGMNGSMVAASLKSTGKARHITIILYDQQPIVEEHRFLSKPPAGVAVFVPSVESGYLVEAVRTVLEQAEAERG